MVPEAWRSGLVSIGRVVGVLFLLGALHKASAVVRYEILEEREKGFVVGNVVTDLGLDLSSLSARRLRVLSGASRRFFEVNRETGEMFVNDRLDREELCGTVPSCTVTLELVVETPLELLRAEVVIQDINDNNPTFPTREMKLEISEAVAPGTRFPLESAHDPDVGSNSLQTYELSLNEYFALRVQTREDGTKYAELVLERALDWEREPSLQVVLTALDGGTPARSATLPIRITVLDANDNAPAFNQSLYRARVLEDAPPGTVVVRVHATDLDEGPNGEIIYSFGSHNRAGVRDLFSLDLVSGVLTIRGRLDFEDTKLHEIYIQAKDKGANPEGAHCKVLVEVVDVNDNAPEITVTSVYSPVPEDAPLGTVIALLSVIDLDAGENGLVSCEVPPGLPFSLTSSLKNYFTLKTSAALDRETVPEYNLSITARDAGTPSLSALTIVQQAPPNTDWRFSQAQRPGTSGSQNGDETGTWPNNQFDTEMLQAMILASASEAADGGSTLGGGAGTMGLSARYGPQFTLQHVPDYRQNVYIPGSNATLTNAAGKRDGKAPTGGNGNKKKSGKKEKK
ncbi:protocadherin gamma-C3 isoform X24 [Prionailurus viverrinus]|uniref:protocadherin gamma-C3 isoform X24 n=1 Tax=Prionailurus viverrinus TaxID=61388 RepID=UPI001FF6F911|nr:protocadherin gamma-C3 isoform X24 [Prionailurus viverrinus]